MPETFEQRQNRLADRPTSEILAEVFVEVCGIVEKKEQAYGGSWRRRGWRGNLIRLLTKGDRLERMLWRTERYADAEETVEDTALDQIALLAMFIINYRAGNEWGQSGGSGSSSESGAGV